VETKKNGCVRITKIPGNHVAQLKESYNIKGLLPAPLITQKKIIALAATAKCCPHLFTFIRLQQQQFLFRQ
jgi:hypothetical protein